MNDAVKKNPLARLQWVDPTTLHANDYNPNRVFKPELKLLKESLMASGWTQPIVARPDGQIVDGFHRWSLSIGDADVLALGGGLVPVAFLDDAVTREEQMMATVRHNRARGQHGILKMGEIVRELKETVSDDELKARLGMEQEEINRLSDIKSSPERHGKDSFGKGWVPDPKSL